METSTETPAISPHELVTHLEALGVRLQLTGGSVTYDAPLGVVHPGLLEQLRCMKPAIVAFLKCRQDSLALWDATLREVAAAWNRAVNTMGQVQPLPDEVAAPLEAEVASAIRAGDRKRTRHAAVRWKAAWLERLGAGRPGHSGDASVVHPRPVDVDASQIRE